MVAVTFYLLVGALIALTMTSKLGRIEDSRDFSERVLGSIAITGLWPFFVFMMIRF